MGRNIDDGGECRGRVINPRVSLLIMNRLTTRCRDDAISMRRAEQLSEVADIVAYACRIRDSTGDRTDVESPRDYAATDFSQQLPSSTTLNCNV